MSQPEAKKDNIFEPARIFSHRFPTKLALEHTKAARDGIVKVTTIMWGPRYSGRENILIVGKPKRKLYMMSLDEFLMQWVQNMPPFEEIIDIEFERKKINYIPKRRKASKRGVSRRQQKSRD